ncbi:MAG: hypothetical protein K1X71_04450 [Pirellulales bacterium]|nr:hypothetical protein [Pirellulales bacterium]
MSPANHLDRARVFFGRLSTTEARVYVELPEAAAGASLHGMVVGPRSRYAKTLPARLPLRPVKATAGLLAEAFVPDPCFWSADSPYLYDVEIELIQDGAVIEQATRLLGLRPLGASGRQLRYEGKNWVLRVAGSLDAFEFSDLHEQELAVVATHPDDQFCRECSEAGVLIVADLDGGLAIDQELERLARWPAVGLAYMVNPEEVPADPRVHARNILLLHRVSDDPRALPWADAVCVRVDELSALPAALVQMEKPVIAWRPSGERVGAIENRRAVDRLQRDVALYLSEHPAGAEPAGYWA